MQAVTPCMEEQPNEVEEVLKLFGGDARKALSAVLGDCHHLHEQLRLTSGAMSVGFTRGWLPKERAQQMVDPLPVTAID
ncbi:hypothetical protein [Rhizobium sp. R86522]|uniref:hypothetical protein n=1 Tax=Rhizobium sp. R86522 TaxID=3093861 RepID=UPI00366C32D4